MTNEWYRDQEAIDMRRSIEQLLHSTIEAKDTAQAAMNAIRNHESVCSERQKALMFGQKILGIMMFMVIVLVLLGPHQGLLALASGGHP